MYIRLKRITDLRNNVKNESKDIELRLNIIFFAFSVILKMKHCEDYV